MGHCFTHTARSIVYGNGVGKYIKLYPIAASLPHFLPSGSIGKNIFESLSKTYAVKNADITIVESAIYANVQIKFVFFLSLSILN